jgi:peptidoglycan/xylan/chitin deacetylase (PgdA/CDA1 family)
MKLRFDRLITLWLYGMMKSGRRSNPERRVSILMYHSICDKIERVHPYFQTITAPRVFKKQLQYLKEHNYNVLSLAKAARWLKAKCEIPYKSVVITFDDGLSDFLTSAAPLLENYRYTATVFLPTAYLDGNSFKGHPCLKWSEVNRLIQRGFSFGSHTVTHPLLRTLNKDEIEYEIRFSKETIENQIGQSVDLFSYPYAFPDHQNEFSQYLCSILEKYGYKIGVTTRIGRASRNDLPFMLKRLPVNSQDDLKLFEMKLNGAYDWLYLLQYSCKILKNALLRKSKHF